MQRVRVVSIFIVVFAIIGILLYPHFFGQKALVKVSSIQTNGETMRVEIIGNIAYIIDTFDDKPGGLVAIDISNPENPKYIGNYYDIGLPMEVKIKNNYAYIANRFNGLEIIDITDPADMKRIYHYKPEEPLLDVLILDQMAIISGDNIGVEILDISTPSNPSLISTPSMNGIGIKLAISSNYLIVEDRYMGTEIKSFDITDPKNPIIVDKYSSQGMDFFEMESNGEYLYVSDHGESGDWFIFKISSGLFELQSRFDSGGTSYGAYIEGDTAYLSDYEKGLLVLDISDKSHVTLLYNHFDGGKGQDVYCKGEYIFFADREDGLEILTIT